MTDEMTLIDNEIETTDNELDIVSTRTGLNIANLLNPISEESPTGVDVRETDAWMEAYYRLRDTRSQLRRQEREANDEQDQAQTARGNWQSIITQASDLLIKAGKDIEITSWLIEGLTRCYGFAGLADGLTFLDLLLTHYKEALYPLPDADGISNTFRAVQSLSGGYAEGALIYPINMSTIIASSARGISYWDYAQAQDNQHAKNEERITMAELENAVRQANSAENAEIFAAITDCLEQIDQVEEKINQQVVSSEFNLTNIRNVVKKCLDAHKHLVSLVKKPAAEQTAIQRNQAAAADNLSSADSGDRQTALLHIEQAYDFFRIQQPHSPITTSLGRILRWANQDLSELVAELIPDMQAQQLFCLITGTNLPLPRREMKNNNTPNFPAENQTEDDVDNF